MATTEDILTNFLSFSSSLHFQMQSFDMHGWKIKILGFTWRFSTSWKLSLTNEMFLCCDFEDCRSSDGNYLIGNEGWDYITWHPAGVMGHWNILTAIFFHFIFWSISFIRKLSTQAKLISSFYFEKQVETIQIIFWEERKRWGCMHGHQTLIFKWCNASIYPLSSSIEWFSITVFEKQWASFAWSMSSLF